MCNKTNIDLDNDKYERPDGEPRICPKCGSHLVCPKPGWHEESHCYECGSEMPTESTIWRIDEETYHGY